MTASYTKIVKSEQQRTKDTFGQRKHY